MHTKIKCSSEGESLFEAYLSIFVEILGEEDIYQTINYDAPVIAIDYSNSDRPWLDRDTKGHSKFIYYVTDKFDQYEDEDIEETHFRLAMKTCRKWEIFDPYHYYQVPRSHGFCQMFTYYISQNKTTEFVDVSEIKSKSKKKEIYALNTFNCLRKTLNMIKKHPLLYNDMSIIFDDIRSDKRERKYYGVHKDMTFKDFIKDLSKFKQNDVDEYISDMMA